MGGNGGLGPKGTPKMLRRTPVEPTEAAARHPQLGVASTQTPDACHGLRGPGNRWGPPEATVTRALPAGKRMLLQGAQGGPYANVPPALALPATGTQDSPASCSPPHGGQWVCRPHPVTPSPSPPPAPIPWAGPALSPSAQLTDPWPSPPHALHPGLWGCPQGPPCPQTGQPCHLASHPALECWGALSSRAGVPTTGWAREGGHAACFLPCQVPRAPHSPAHCRSPVGTRWLARCGPLLPPPPAVQFPVQVCAIPDGGLLGGMTCWGGTRCSERARPAWTSSHPPAQGPSHRGWTPPRVLWNLLHVTQIPSDPARPAPSRPPWWSGHSHGAGDTRSARPRPTGRGCQGEDRLG